MVGGSSGSEHSTRVTSRALRSSDRTRSLRKHCLSLRHPAEGWTGARTLRSSRLPGGGAREPAAPPHAAQGQRGPGPSRRGRARAFPPAAGGGHSPRRAHAPSGPSRAPCFGRARGPLRLGAAPYTAPRPARENYSSRDAARLPGSGWAVAAAAREGCVRASVLWRRQRAGRLR